LKLIKVLAALVVLYLVFGVIRPAFRNLSRPANSTAIGVTGEIGSDGTASVDKDGNPLGISNQTRAVDADGNELPNPEEVYQLELELARKLVVDDPKVAAQVIKNWIK